MSPGLCNVKYDRSLTKEEIDNNFSDLHQPFNLLQAQSEASRCLYCYDAPCIDACPTSIDVPTFIHQIRAENINGSAKTILSQNIMGGTCARACPTEILCEQACVLNASQQQPVQIGSLQRFAVDHLMEKKDSHPFKRGPLTGKKLAVIGAGPAGLSCAHRAAMLGHDVTVFEAKNKSGGLNEYGLAAYKMVDDFAQKEVEFLLQIGGVTIEYGKILDKNLSIQTLQDNYDAIFIGVGLSDTNGLGIQGEDDLRVVDAIQFIEELRQADDKSLISIGNDVVVIGAGNTAIDAAVQAKNLGAKNVTLIYRRGEEFMSATEYEIDLARRNDIKMIFWAVPCEFINQEPVASIKFERTKLVKNKLVVTGDTFELPTDMVLKAIGQKLDQDNFSNFEIKNKKIVVSDRYETSIQGIFAGGDCIASGVDLTVQAVEDGKQAAIAINEYLSSTGLNESERLDKPDQSGKE